MDRERDAAVPERQIATTIGEHVRKHRRGDASALDYNAWTRSCQFDALHILTPSHQGSSNRAPSISISPQSYLHNLITPIASIYWISPSITMVASPGTRQYALSNHNGTISARNDLDVSVTPYQGTHFACLHYLLWNGGPSNARTTRETIIKNGTFNVPEFDQNLSPDISLPQPPLPLGSTPTAYVMLDVKLATAFSRLRREFRDGVAEFMPAGYPKFLLLDDYKTIFHKAEALDQAGKTSIAKRRWNMTISDQPGIGMYRGIWARRWLNRH